MIDSSHSLTRNGWKIFKYRLFDETYSSLNDEVRRLKREDAESFGRHPKAKLLARVNQVIYDEIPANPTDVKYRQGNTLGERHKQWFRAKFMGRFRLFFRFDSTEKIIIYCWLNDENTLRKAGSKTDPYKVFVKMLTSRNLPHSWIELKKATPGASMEPQQAREEI
jgi:toxin YhaV